MNPLSFETAILSGMTLYRQAKCHWRRSRLAGAIVPFALEYDLRAPAHWTASDVHQINSCPLRKIAARAVGMAQSACRKFLRRQGAPRAYGLNRDRIFGMNFRKELMMDPNDRFGDPGYGGNDPFGRSTYHRTNLAGRDPLSRAMYDRNRLDDMPTGSLNIRSIREAIYYVAVFIVAGLATAYLS